MSILIAFFGGMLTCRLSFPTAPEIQQDTIPARRDARWRPGRPAGGWVLQPFFRLEDSRNRDTGGTGLGLAIAAQLVSQMKFSNCAGDTAGYNPCAARRTLASRPPCGRLDRRNSPAFLTHPPYISLL
jgi:hypothetical protein